jgi:hypothetical protein
VSTKTDHDDDGFSAIERRALALWRPPEPPAAFAERVVAAAREARGTAPVLRGAAVAAVALLLGGGLLTARTLVGPSPSVPALGEGLVSPDAGPRPEVRQADDGQEGTEGRAS